MYNRYENSNREEYYEQFIFPKKILQIHQWNQSLEGEGVIKTDFPIRFRNIDFDSTKKSVFEQNGKPRFIRQHSISSEKNFSERHSGKNGNSGMHEIAFYKDLINNHKLISQLHFFNDLFFYGCHTFRYLPREKFSMVKKMLTEKYDLDEEVFNKSDVITDRFNNQIRIVDNVFLNLVYLSGEENFKSLIKEYAKEYSFEKKKNTKPFLMDLYSLL